MTRRSGVSYGGPVQYGARKPVEKERKFYVGLFIDPRFHTSNSRTFSSQLLTFGARKINLTRRFAGEFSSDIVYDTVDFYYQDEHVGRYTLPYGLRFFKNQWRHLGIQFRNGQAPLIYIDGFAVGAASSVGNAAKWKMNAMRVWGGQIIRLGSREDNRAKGIYGWVDEFKVIARDPTDEETCNYARGTLARVTNNNFWAHKADNLYSEYWQGKVADTVGESRNNSYVCYVNYGNTTMRDLTPNEVYAQLDRIPAGLVSIREKHITENKALIYNQPRPAQDTNRFCLSCHISDNDEVRDGVSSRELGISAFRLVNNLPTQLDPRRQPLQPPGLMGGNIPANYFGPGKPAQRIRSTTPSHVDQWLMNHN
ncbi:MAG: hypothetical protein HRT45_08920 [Bdellovibrionales bacterium]|nr:hypothetical protein [Bdellovibrionales bacterium]